MVQKDKKTTSDAAAQNDMAPLNEKELDQVILSG